MIYFLYGKSFRPIRWRKDLEYRLLFYLYFQITGAMNLFSERYKTYTTAELLKVIQNPGDYQLIAVNAAREELEYRNLSEEELMIAKSELDQEKQEEIRKKERRQALEESIREKGNVIADYINPIQKTKSRSGKLITSIFLVFMLISILQILTQYELIASLFTSPFSEWDFSVAVFLYPVIMTPLCAILFWRRLKIGWILFTVFLSSVITASLFMLVAYYLMELLLDALFYGNTLWTICSRKVFEVYRIEKDMIYKTIIPSAVITMLILGIAFLL